MLHPSYSDLMKIVNEEAEGDTPVVNSRYSIVMATAKRAREIISDEGETAKRKAKPLSVAVDELNNGILHILPDDAPDEEPVAISSSADQFAFDAVSERGDDSDSSVNEEDEEDEETAEDKENEDDEDEDSGDEDSGDEDEDAEDSDPYEE